MKGREKEGRRGKGRGAEEREGSKRRGGERVKGGGGKEREGKGRGRELIIQGCNNLVTRLQQGCAITLLQPSYKYMVTTLQPCKLCPHASIHFLLTCASLYQLPSPTPTAFRSLFTSPSQTFLAFFAFFASCSMCKLLISALRGLQILCR